MTRIAALVLLSFVCADLARADGVPYDQSWHFLTVTRSGTVSLIKDLTKSECDHLRDSLPKKQWECDNPDDHPDDGRIRGWCYTSVEPSDFVKVECFQ